jgi:hypothetical protein
MTGQEYFYLIWTVCGIAWGLVWLPCILHLTVAWGKGSHGCFPRFQSEEIKCYYKLFLPAVDIGRLAKDELQKDFERRFRRLYGRQRYVLPLVLLIVLSAIGFWGTARTLGVWEGISANKFSFRPMVISAFLGAFVWVVNDQLGRLRNSDLTFHDVYSAAFRFLLAVPFGFCLQPLANPSIGIAVAFLLGVFPTGTLFTMGRRLAVREMRLGEDSTQSINELEKLQSVSRSSAERFTDEGINTISELAWCDPVDLTLRTNQEFDYVVDCESQALVWVYFGDKTKELYKVSLRSAHEVTSLIYSLESSDPERRNLAESALHEAATVLSLSPEAVRHTLRQIEEDPFTRFLVTVWHWPTREAPQGETASQPSRMVGQSVG